MSAPGALVAARGVATCGVGAVVIAAGLVLAACSGADVPGDGPTLPPIQTTSTVPVTVATATTLPQYYRVQRGDTLTEIAAAYEIPVVAIMELNGLTNPDDIYAGQILAIPPRDIVASVLPATVPGQTAPTLAPTTTLGPPTTTTA
jgi:lipoprotein NlpD